MVYRVKLYRSIMTTRTMNFVPHCQNINEGNKVTVSQRYPVMRPRLLNAERDEILKGTKDVCRNVP